MNKRTSAAVATMAVGVVAGTAAYMLSGSNSRAMKARTRNIKRSTGKALRQVGSFIDSVSDMMH